MGHHKSTYDPYPISISGEKMSFPSFAALRQHLSRMHEQFFCHICLDNLNVLSKDRDAYSQINLSLHMDGKLNEENGFQGKLYMAIDR